MKLIQAMTLMCCTAAIGAALPQPQPAATATSDSRLPAKASTLPMIGLFALTAVGGAVAVRAAEKRRR